MKEHSYPDKKTKVDKALIRIAEWVDERDREDHPGYRFSMFTPIASTPSIPPPRESAQVYGGRLEYNFMYEHFEDFTHVGVAPTPDGRFQTFKFHMLHGLMMGYPFLSVLLYSLLYRNYAPSSIAYIGDWLDDMRTRT